MSGRHFLSRRHAGARLLLASRGRSLRVFAAQTVFVSLALLALGAYLLEEQFADPMQAQGAGLLFAALLIAAAVSLLYFLICPARKIRHHRIVIRTVPLSSWSDEGVRTVEAKRLAWRQRHEGLSDLRYVDRARVRL